MSRALAHLFALLAAALLLPAGLKAQIVINEVLANEPGAERSLEWIELFNRSEDDVSLNGFVLHVDGDILDPLGDVSIPGRDYVIICRRLFSEGNATGFEARWGNNSLIWGDVAQEARLLRPIEMPALQLDNTGNILTLLDNMGNVLSTFTWSESGRDGYSWERVSPGSAIIEQSTDPGGSTPGYVNSSTPVDNDLALSLDSVWADEGWVGLKVTIRNEGNAPQLGAHLGVCRLSDVDTVLVERIALPQLRPGESFTFEHSYVLEGTYVSLLLELPDDDRPTNNTITFVAPGAEFPQLILSEFLANPVRDFGVEWVEIRNISDDLVDLNGWQLGDSLAWREIVLTTLNVGPGSYVVLARDSAAFLEFYSDFAGTLVEPGSWPTLNNSHDLVRLMCPFDILADRFSYGTTFPDNYTWSRSADPQHDGEWGRSERPGGTPGEPNEVFFGPSGSSVKIEIKPRIISPDGDGIDEFAIIKVEAPVASEYSLKLYDRQGREIYVFDPVRDENVWDGRGGGGQRVPVGLYILYFEADGGESAKETIVVAR